MKDIPLRDYLKKNTQAALARKIGVTQGAVYQMARSDRNIFVRVNSKGSVIAAYEVRAIGSIRSVTCPANPDLAAA